MVESERVVADVQAVPPIVTVATVAAGPKF